MTDRDLALAFTQVQDIERTTREHMQTKDLAERDAALSAMRLATALRRNLESWIGVRTIRRQMDAEKTVPGTRPLTVGL